MQKRGMGVLWILVLIFWNQTGLGGQRTQLNEVSDLFDHIPERRAVQQGMEDEKLKVINSMKEGRLSDIPFHDEGKERRGEWSSPDGSELESLGRRSKEAQEFHNEEWLINQNAPGMERHKEDAELIAGSGEKLMDHLLRDLKEKGIECHEVVRKEEPEPQWKIEIEKKQEKERIYDMQYCEHLRNRYDCHNELSLECLHFAEKVGDAEIIGSDMRYEDRGGEMRSYRFEGNYGGGGEGKKWGGGRKYGFVNKKKGTTYEASEKSWRISFRVDTDLATLGRIELSQLRYGVFILIRVNGAVAYAGPEGGDRPELNGHVEVKTKGKRKYGGVAGKRIKIITKYPRVITGEGEYGLGLDRVSHSSAAATIDLRPYIRQGGNEMEILAISLGGNAISFNLNISERSCKHWRERWNESCRLIIGE